MNAHKHWQAVATMRDPVVVTTGDGLHLDGPLAFAAWQEARQKSHAGNPLEPLTDDHAPDFDLPLGKWEHNGLWGWKCSAAMPINGRYAAEFVRRMPPIEEYIKWTSSSGVQIGAGPAKAINKPVQTVFSRTVVWTFEGDGPAALRLLNDHIMHIGKLRGHGNGAVIGWEVRELAGEWSPVVNGRLIRRMPAGFSGLRGTHRGGLRAPYWHKTRLINAVGPEIGR